MENKNIEYIEGLVKPDSFKKLIPSSDETKKFINETRNSISNIIKKKDKRKLFIVGPCSIHNVEQAYEYAKELKILSDSVKDKILIVMRVYFEKPRTTIGWKGLINDPDLDGSFKINKGLLMARKLLSDINELKLPCGYEVLDTITPQYISDLISWGAIGARTTESQIHRQLVSGLSMPIGFKNGTEGNINICRDAIVSAGNQHCFMGINENGNVALCKTQGNLDCHLILRGGKNPNYEYSNIVYCEQILTEKGIQPSIMVDCSHGNSMKDYKNQHKVLEETINNCSKTNSIIGIMLESNLNEGKQKLTLQKNNKNLLKYGVSVTDCCVSMDETIKIIISAYNKL